MKSSFALSIAPILMFAFGQQAFAETGQPTPGHHAQPSRLAANRHTKTRLASASGRHSRHTGVRHLTVRHVEGRHVVAASHVGSYGVAETDGWNPADAGISPPAATMTGASVQLASFEQPGSSDQMSANESDDSQVGLASYYARRYDGRRTSSGAVFHDQAMTAAHASLPFGTKVLVRVKGTDRSVVVTITDRLETRHRIIDLSKGAAERLGIVHDGLAMVMLTPEN